MSSPAQGVLLADATTEDIELRIASTREERAAAFRLVYRSYLDAGLGMQNPWEMRITPYQLLATSEIFIATLREEAIFTMTLVIDGRLGLPIEHVYGEEVARLRRRGLLLGEVSCLADRRRAMRGFFPVFLRLSRMVAQYAWRRGVDRVLVACHPKHARFYQRLLSFRQIGKQTVYPAVRNHPAVALSLDLTQLAWEDPEAHSTLFYETIPAERLEPQPITAADREHFAAMVDPRFPSVPVGAALYEPAECLVQSGGAACQDVAANPA